MRRSFLVVLGLLTFEECLGASIEEIAETAIPSVVLIVTYDITGAQRGQGTGFFVSPQRIITNEHVVHGAYSAEVFSDENYYDLVTILKAREEIDLAIISVNASNEQPLEMSPDTELKPGQRVVAIGNPLGFENTLSDGLISAVRTIDGLQIVQITAPISPGSSGGPLLDEEGKVIGVVSATIQEGQNLNFAIGSETVRDFLLLQENPEALKIAHSRVLWRVIVKWVVVIIASLIALLFGGGWWVIAIAIVIIIVLWNLLAWSFKCVYRFVTPRAGGRRSFSPATFDPDLCVEQPLTPSHDARPLLEEETDNESINEDDDRATLHCWKCGRANYVGPDSNEEIICSECGTTLPVPPELWYGE